MNKCEITKIEINEQILVINLIEGRIEDIITKLETYKKEGWQRIVYVYRDLFDDCTLCYLSKSRLETDEEYQKRVNQHINEADKNI